MYIITKQTERQRDIETERKRNRETVGHREIGTERQRDRERYGQRDKVL